LGDAANKPICAVIIGMAGSGKTTLTQVTRHFPFTSSLPFMLLFVIDINCSMIFLCVAWRM